MCDIDIANQIQNSWNKDSVMALVGSNVSFALKIRADLKKEIKEEFISNQRPHDTKVVALVHAYLIFKCLQINKDKHIKKVKFCRDCRPDHLISNYLQKIASVEGWPTITQDINIAPRLPTKIKLSDGTIKKIPAKESKAHKLANECLKNRIKENYLINKTDIENLKIHLKKRL